MTLPFIERYRYFNDCVWDHSFRGIEFHHHRHYPSWGHPTHRITGLSPSAPIDPLTPSLFSRCWNVLAEHGVPNLSPRDDRWTPLSLAFDDDIVNRLIRVKITCLYPRVFGVWQISKSREWDEILRTGEIGKKCPPTVIKYLQDHSFPLLKNSVLKGIEDSWMSSFPQRSPQELQAAFSCHQAKILARLSFLDSPLTNLCRLRGAWAEVKIHYARRGHRASPDIRRISCTIRSNSTSRWSGESWICNSLKPHKLSCHFKHCSPGVLCRFDLA